MNLFNYLEGEPNWKQEDKKVWVYIGSQEELLQPDKFFFRTRKTVRTDSSRIFPVNKVPFKLLHKVEGHIYTLAGGPLDLYTVVEAYSLKNPKGNIVRYQVKLNNPYMITSAMLEKEVVAHLEKLMETPPKPMAKTPESAPGKSKKAGGLKKSEKTEHKENPPTVLKNPEEGASSPPSSTRDSESEK